MGELTMDHATIAERALVDRYVQGRLSAQERVDFEDHFIECPQCLEELELAEAFRTGVKDAVAVEVARQATLGVVARLLKARRMLALVVVCGLALPLAWWWGRSGAGPSLQPQANVATYTLGSLRAVDVPALELPAGEWVTLELPAEAGAFPAYRLALVDGEGEALWQPGEVLPDREGLLRVTFPPGSLPRGELVLRLDGVPGGGEAPVGLLRQGLTVR
jgi:hypothetical protein